jgi:hypothetical protein
VLSGVLCVPNTLQPLRRRAVKIKMEKNLTMFFITHLLIL